MERSQATVHFDQLKLESIVRTVVSDIDGALHASVATVTDGQTSVLVTTDPAFDIEEDDGPATSTLQTGRVRRVPSVLNNGGEFPAYVTRCIAAGISSVAAFPIKRGATTVAVLTITSADHHGFGTADLRVARDAAAAVERCLANTSATAR